MSLFVIHVETYLLLASFFFFFFNSKVKQCAVGKDFFEGPYSLLSEVQNKASVEYSALAEYSVCCYT